MATTDNKRSLSTDTPGPKKTKITDFFLSKKTVVAKKPETPAAIPKTSSTTPNTISKPKTSNQITFAKNTYDDETDPDFSIFKQEYKFDKEKWVASLSDEEKELLDLEIKYLHITWLTFLYKELTKPYFLSLKRFLKAQLNKTVFPPPNKIYSWSHYTPLPRLKCLVLGQDPYHNFNQAHGLAFSVLEPTKPPPSLKNIYKAILNDYPNFKPPDSSRGGGGNLTQWAERGVLLLNTCLTVEAHKANSHSKHGWETFTQKVIDVAINFHMNEKSTGFVVMAWGMPAQNTIAQFGQLRGNDKFFVMKTFHPSPFSAAKGFFTAQCFKKCNDWLESHGRTCINWSLVEGNVVL